MAKDEKVTMLPKFLIWGTIYEYVNSKPKINPDELAEKINQAIIDYVKNGWAIAVVDGKTMFINIEDKISPN